MSWWLAIAGFRTTLTPKAIRAEAITVQVEVEITLLIEVEVG